MQPEPIVYVIDDDDAVRQSLEFLLKTAGISARGFDSARAFLEVLPADQIRLHHHRRAHAGNHRHRPLAPAQGESESTFRSSSLPATATYRWQWKR